MSSHHELLGALRRRSVTVIGSGAWACAAARMVAQNAARPDDAARTFEPTVKMWVYEEDVDVRCGYGNSFPPGTHCIWARAHTGGVLHDGLPADAIGASELQQLPHRKGIKHSLAFAQMRSWLRMEGVADTFLARSNAGHL